MTPHRLDDERHSLATRAAAVLYGLGATHVWLFGSLAASRLQDRRSDLDLAVDGLQRGALERAAEAAERIVGCHVDLVDAAAIPPALRASVIRTRVLLRRQPEDSAAEAASSRWYSARATDPVRRLFLKRIDSIRDVIRGADASSVIDLGCGAGWLIEILAREPRIERVSGVDLSEEALQLAQRRMARTMPPAQLARVRLFLGVLTHRNPRLLGHDAAVVSEVIEHMDPPRLRAFEHVLFDFIRPRVIVVTTPNREYNVKWRLGPSLRHDGHRFEWTRDGFEKWTRPWAAAAGYEVIHHSIGPEDVDLGAPTQMAVFTRGERCD